MAEILIAEDDAPIRTWLAEAFGLRGHVVRTAEDGVAALEAIRSVRPDLLVLDVTMPRKDGFDVCRDIRRTDATLPILMLTARDTEDDKVMGLGLGADDYVTKPFGLKELFARVDALLRRAYRAETAARTDDAPILGSCRLDVRRHALVDAKGVQTPLAEKEYALLRLLLAHPNEVLTRERLLNEVWGVGFDGTTRTLDQHVAILRRKLGIDGACIRTARNTGYFLDGIHS